MVDLTEKSLLELFVGRLLFMIHVAIVII